MQDMKITIEVNAPGIVSALTLLAEAISGARNQTPVIIAPVEKTKVEKAVDKVVAKVIEKASVPTPTVVEAEFETISEEPVEAKPEVTYTLEQVRAKLAALSQAGKSAEVKQLIASFGTSKLSDIQTDKYAELMEKAEAIV